MTDGTHEEEISDAVSASELKRLVMCIERMAIEINSAPPDMPSVTMKPSIWLLWEKVLHEAGIDPAIGTH